MPPEADPTVAPQVAAAAGQSGRIRQDVAGSLIDVVSMEAALDRVHAWAHNAKGRYVCFTNVHAVVTARSSPELRRALEEADLVAPDGAPIAWMQRRMGQDQPGRIYGPDFFWAYCAMAEAQAEPIFLFGSTERNLELLRVRLKAAFPRLPVAGAIAPPFRPPTPAEEQAHLAAINASGARTVWIGLGCPKQEIWMHAHRETVHAVMLGVGAAFDFHAGTLRQAPRWMQDSGLEWLFRLAAEPRRLWKRYFTTNSAFIALAAAQLLRRRRAR